MSRQPPLEFEKHVPHRAKDSPWRRVMRALPPALAMIRLELTNRKRRGVARKFRGMLRLMAHLPAYIGYLRLMICPQLLDLSRRNPGLLSKPLRSDYLARSLQTRDRLNILAHHYRFLGYRVKKEFVDDVYGAGCTLWQERLGDKPMRIRLVFPRKFDYEGDLSLVFECDGVAIYSITFTIAAGKAIRLEAAEALFISNVQGVASRMELMRTATRICHDTAPVHLLLAAAQALALSLGMKAIVGITHEEQVAVAYGITGGDAIFFDYDRFWQSYMAESHAGRYYVMPVPFPEKPLSEVKAKHRARTQLRRELRKRIIEQAGACMVSRGLKDT